MKITTCIFFVFLFFQSYKTHCQTWQSFDSLRIEYQSRKLYDSAHLYGEKALHVANARVGGDDTLTAQLLNTLVEINYLKNDFSKAIKYCEKEKIIIKTVHGKNNNKYINILNDLGVLYHKIGKFDSSEVYLNEAIKICSETFGENNKTFTNVLNELAGLYNDKGQAKEAIPLYLKVIQIQKELTGGKDPSYAKYLSNLAINYQDMKDYLSAEKYLIESINIKKESEGEHNLTYAISLNNLAELYSDMGNYQDAEPLLIKSKEIRKEVLGENHPDYATVLNNLGNLYKKMSRFTEAEQLLKESTRIRRATLGEKHYKYTIALNNLALLYNEMGKYSEVEPLMLESISIRKETLGEKHPAYALSIDNLGVFYYEQGNYLAAEPLFVKAIHLRKESFGIKNRDYSVSVYNLACVYLFTGRLYEAYSLFLECLEIYFSYTYRNFSFMTESEKELFFKTQSGYFDSFYSFSLKFIKQQPDLTKNVFNYVIKNKGNLLKSSTALRSSILNSSDTSLINKYNKWIGLKKEISITYATEISKRKNKPELLEKKANEIEKELVKSSDIFKNYEINQSITWETVRNSLKPSEAAIEFLRFNEGKKKDTIVYCALLITPQSKQPEMIRLFEEKQLTKILNSSEASNFTQVNSIYGTLAEQKDHLYRIIWKPMEKFLKGIKTIYYSPDGILHNVSFAAICKHDNMYLCDDFNLQQVSSTGMITLPENTFIDKKTTACVFGGIDYSADSTNHSLWKYLPGTLIEANTISTKLSKNKIKVLTYTGKEATELIIKTLFSKEDFFSEILHIATHGFFYPDPEQFIKEEKTKEKGETSKVTFRGDHSGFGLWQFVKNKNPLMRSGVVLAGANKVWSEPYSGTDNEGVLTAQEVTQLNMTKTKLVVLSACETGLGDIKGSEGVYGLQRALKMAGVKYIIMSLWQVPDKETVEFMETFYTKLLKYKNIRKAFSETQKEMRKKYDPYFWGAFVLIE